MIGDEGPKRKVKTYGTTIPVVEVMLAEKAVDAEIIDLRTFVSLDLGTTKNSAEKAGQAKAISVRHTAEASSRGGRVHDDVSISENSGCWVLRKPLIFRLWNQQFEETEANDEDRYVVSIPLPVRRFSSAGSSPGS